MSKIMREMDETSIDYSMLPLHMQDGMRLYIEEGIQGGSFLTAVLCNDLAGAVGRADYINRNCLVDYVKFLYNEAPALCKGSPEIVQAWIGMGGLRGLKRRREALERGEMNEPTS